MAHVNGEMGFDSIPDAIEAFGMQSNKPDTTSLHFTWADT
jgi:hypothetical protein